MTFNTNQSLIKMKIHRETIFKLSVVLIFCISFFLRIYKLESYPLQMNVDEISYLYDGYSIKETGADHWGVKYPVILHGFGSFDYHPPLYAWLNAASISIFGYSDFAGRVPSAILGCLSLILIFSIAKRTGGKVFSFFALLSAGLCPWHMLFSRIGHEGTMLPAFLFILSVYLWLKAKEHNFRLGYILLIGFVIGLGTNSYHGAKLNFFLLSIFVGIDILKNSQKFLKNLGLFGLLVMAAASPQIAAAIIYPQHFFTRANDTMIHFSLTTGYFLTIARNFLLNLSPFYLFLLPGLFNNLSVIRLLPVEILFFYAGLIFFLPVFRKSILKPFHFFLLLFIAILPAALTMPNPHALRGSSLTVLLPFVSANGIVFFYKKIKRENFKIIFLILTSGLIIMNATFFIYKYVNSYRMKNAGHQNELVQVCKKLDNYKDKYASIYMEETFNQPFIYVLHYCNIHPKMFMQYKKIFNPLNDEYLLQMDKYYFISRPIIYRKIKESKTSFLFIVKEKNESYRLLDSVPDHNKYIYFYSSF
jgi:4-amino-4-deoxy-L-arabinose transferase-like glycosyltransferase